MWATEDRDRFLRSGVRSLTGRCLGERCWEESGISREDQGRSSSAVLKGLAEEEESMPLLSSRMDTDCMWLFKFKLN